MIGTPLDQQAAARRSAELLIRDARVDDLRPLMALEQSAFAEDAISARQMRYLLTRANGRLLIAELAGRLVGSAVVLFSRATAVARIYSLAVSVEARGRGLGRRLIEAAEQAALQAGRFRVRLEVRPDNQPALALYQAMGYRRIDDIADYYHDHSNAWRLERQLDAS